MRSIVTFSPFQELHRFADMMDRMWEGQSVAGFGSSFSIPIDVWEENNNILVKAAVPGIDPNQVEINIENSILTISGEFKDDHETQAENRKMYHREMRYGYFSRSIALPEDVDEEKPDAEYRNGFIMIRIPRKKQQPHTAAKKIPIRNAESTQALNQGQGNTTPNRSGEQSTVSSGRNK